MRHFSTLFCLTLALAACSEASDAPSSAPSKPAGDFGFQGGNLESPESANACENVPEQYKGAADGCDCPAGGNRGCDSDCDNGKAGGMFCGCDYCYNPPEGSDSQAQPSEDEDSDDGQDESSDDGEGLTSEATSSDQGDSNEGNDETTSEPEVTPESVPSDEDGDDETTSEPEVPPEAVTTSGTSDEDGANEPPILLACAEIPSENIGNGDGCDCSALGDLGCDPDCNNGNNAVGSCGCDYCHPEEEDQPEEQPQQPEESEDEQPILLACAEIPSENIGNGDGCDCSALGDLGCDPDCNNGNNAVGSCGCDYCHPEEEDQPEEQPQQPEEPEDEQPILLACSEIPSENIGADDGCDCNSLGDLGCDSDCNNGNRGDQDCGCEFCH